MSGTMPSWLEVTCRRQWIRMLGSRVSLGEFPRSTALPKVRRVTRLSFPPPPSYPKSTKLYTLVSRPKSFRRCSFRKTRYTVVYRDVNSVFFIFTRSLEKYKFSELNKICSDSFFIERIRHSTTLWWSWLINLLYNVLFHRKDVHSQNKPQKKRM